MATRKREGWVQVEGQAGLYVKAKSTPGATAQARVEGTRPPASADMRAVLDQFGQTLDAFERESDAIKQSRLMAFARQR